MLGAFYLLVNLFSGNQRQYLAGGPAGWRGLFQQARWYLYGIFKGDPHPSHSTPQHKFNPLQRVT